MQQRSQARFGVLSVLPESVHMAGGICFEHGHGLQGAADDPIAPQLGHIDLHCARSRPGLALGNGGGQAIEAVPPEGLQGAIGRRKEHGLRGCAGLRQVQRSAPHGVGCLCGYTAWGVYEPGQEEQDGQDDAHTYPGQQASSGEGHGSRTQETIAQAAFHCGAPNRFSASMRDSAAVLLSGLMSDTAAQASAARR